MLCSAVLRTAGFQAFPIDFGDRDLDEKMHHVSALIEHDAKYDLFLFIYPVSNMSLHSCEKIAIFHIQPLRRHSNRGSI